MSGDLTFNSQQDPLESSYLPRGCLQILQPSVDFQTVETLLVAVRLIDEVICDMLQNVIIFLKIKIKA